MARILIIDDNDDVRTVVAGALESAGHEVVLAPDSARGVEFTDIGLPGGVNGRELADAALRRTLR